jgi:hypothetical protein
MVAAPPHTGFFRLRPGATLVPVIRLRRRLRERQLTPSSILSLGAAATGRRMLLYDHATPEAQVAEPATTQVVIILSFLLGIRSICFPPQATLLISVLYLPLGHAKHSAPLYQYPLLHEQ